MFKIYMKAPKHACFHVFSPLSASFYPHYITMVKGLLALQELSRKELLLTLLVSSLLTA